MLTQVHKKIANDTTATPMKSMALKVAAFAPEGASISTPTAAPTLQA